jgi:hypothetical protein
MAGVVIENATPRGEDLPAAHTTSGRSAQVIKLRVDWISAVLRRSPSQRQITLHRCDRWVRSRIMCSEKQPESYAETYHRSKR